MIDEIYQIFLPRPRPQTPKPPSPSSARHQEGQRGHSSTLHCNHMHGLSVSVTVYGPWDRPDMAYFFTRSIPSGKPVTLLCMPDGTAVRRDFTYIDDDVVKVASAPSTPPRGEARHQPRI
ncbi:UDP-glucuronate 4-epimerase [Musa troglodytarum]|uniref:UDP-glucuronate 4-epimerase n=1 Tax=Musa troglodytarum TaxID=320322 RepID=A0A9E7K2T8_9LILI|nr:UDP-glucuronate 4-epimerase [Musa troglodytarum]